MKKIMLLCLMLVFALISCINNTSSTDSMISYLNSKNVSIWSYNERIGYDTLENNDSFSDFSDINFDNYYTIIIIDANKYYDNISIEFLNLIYEKLVGPSKVGFLIVDAPNENFFHNSLFTNDTDYYGNTSYIDLKYNFSEITGVRSISIDYTFDNDINKFDYASLNTIYNVVSKYEALI